MTGSLSRPATLIARAFSEGPDCLGEIADVDSVVQHAETHGVIALLWWRLSTVPGVHPALLNALAPATQIAAARELVVQRELRQVLGALAAAGIDVLVTKGTALAYTVYEEPYLRFRLDTDLLVREASVPATLRVLDACGYRQHHGVNTGSLVLNEIPFERVDAHGLHHLLDLHWKIASPKLLSDAVAFDALWPEALAVPALGPTARIPSHIANVAIACLHRVAHHQGNERLIWLYDLRVLTRDFTEEDWARLVRFAIDRGIAGVCLDGLAKTRAWLGLPLPPQVVEALETAAPAESSQRYLEKRISRRDVLISDLTLLPSWSARARLLREHAFPPAAFIRHRYATNSRWLLPILYVHRLVSGAYRWVRH